MVAFIFDLTHYAVPKMITKTGILLACCTCLLFSETSGAQPVPPDCSQTAAALDFWRPVRQAVTSDDYVADQLAPALISCLGSTNSELRDSIGYELFSYWLRNDALSQQSKIDLLEVLSSNIQQSDDTQALNRSFSALVVSELLRADNLSNFIDDADRLRLLQITVNALVAESDYRGLVEDIGWVHPVAHLADVLWRFALHTSLNTEQSRIILESVRNKVGTTTTGYIFNEGDRLARPISTLILQDALDASDIVNWLGLFETPAAGGTWFDAYFSVQGMHELHNTKLFIRALSDQLRMEGIDEGIRKRLDELVASLTAIV